MVGDHAIPTPPVVLAIHRPRPSKLESVLEGVEGGIEDNDDFGVIRVEFRSNLGTYP